MNTLANQLVRPYRFIYNMIDLGRKKTAEYERHDGVTVNDRKQKILYSYYANTRPSDVCVIYAHCNSGCRVQGIQYVRYFIEKGWNVLLFDFSGSGLSEGNTVSLGFYEARDLKKMIEEMEARGNHQFILWGRSMGASTILFYLGQFGHKNVVGCVLDSPYASLWRLASDIGNSMTGLPNFIITGVLSLIRTKIKQQHGFDIKLMNPSEMLKNIKCPLLFITSLKDEFVSSDHVVELYKSYDGTKRLEYIDSGHNSSRPEEIIRIAVDYIDGLDRKKKQRSDKKPPPQKSAEFKEFKKFKSFKLLRETPYQKENLDLNYTEQFEQGDYGFIQAKLKQKLKLPQFRKSNLDA